MSRATLEFAGQQIKPGRRKQVELPIAKMASGTQVSLPVIVVHGKTDGPSIWLDAAIHGDEINGIEIIRRVLRKVDARTLAGTIYAVPTVNVHGFLANDRYMPDRRDLNRSFPGSARGSLASRIAYLFMNEIVSRCELGIDLHSGSGDRKNLPQIRADLTNARTRDLAAAFGAPVMISAKTRGGSIRAVAAKRGKTVLLYEAGEASRYDMESIELGEAGVERVIAELGMIEPCEACEIEPRIAGGSHWIRARRSGLFLSAVELGQQLELGDTVGVIHDSLGNRRARMTTRAPGVVIGLMQRPLVNQGDALMHVAEDLQPVSASEVDTSS
ncbi:MAG: succinylglutamate desuccinylase/aspartoacylase family protein [Acidimicrobiales bacterium]